MKECLRRKNELLIFSNIDKVVKDVYKEKKQRKLEDIFMTSKIRDIHMITYEESIERMEVFYEIEIKKDLKDSLLKLNKYRNITIHSGVSLDVVEVLETVYYLANSLDFYFEQILNSEYDISIGYISLKKAIEHSKEYSENIKLYKCIINILKKEEINVGLGEVIHITDINKAFNFLNNFFKQNFILGADLINGFCSGSITKITRTKTEFNVYTDDNQSIYNFKFKGMLVGIPPSLESNESPLIFIESLSNKKEEIEDKFIETLLKDKKYINEVHILSEDKRIYGDDIYAFYERENLVEYDNIYYFIDGTVLIFLNIQKFSYGIGKYILEKTEKENLLHLRTTIVDYYSKKNLK